MTSWSTDYEVGALRSQNFSPFLILSEQGSGFISYACINILIPWNSFVDVYVLIYSRFIFFA